MRKPLGVFAFTNLFCEEGEWQSVSESQSAGAYVGFLFPCYSTPNIEYSVGCKPPKRLNFNTRIHGKIIQRTVTGLLLKEVAVSHGGTVVPTINGWSFESHSPQLRDVVLGPNHADGRSQLSFTAEFTDLSPVVLRVSQGTATGELRYYNDPLLINNSGYDWTTFRTDLITVNNPTAQGLNTGVHPHFAHFHDAQYGWATPNTTPYTVQHGVNSQTNELTQFGPGGINGADQLWNWNGTIANGTQQPWQDLGVHEYPVEANTQTGGLQAGDFYLVMTPNFWPVHDRILPTSHVVYEDTTPANDAAYVGTAKNDLAFGYDGNDRLEGAAGDDVVVGGTGLDSLWGGDGADWLYGGADNDELIGGVDRDVLDGGAGTDRAVYTDTADALTVRLAGIEAVAVEGTGDLVRNIEDIWAGTGNDTLIGDDTANFLWGYLGDDTLQGRVGIDFLEGGEGLDTADYSDQSAGLDLELLGGAWSRAKVGGVEEDWVVNVEKVIGTGFHDRILGDANTNYIFGGGADDLMRGGLGRDYLTGGTENDRFDFNSYAEAGLGADRDVIMDFSHAEGDKIDLHTLDANTNKGGNQNFRYIGGKDFSGTAGEVRYSDSEALVQGDVNGDRVADFEIELATSANPFLAKDDFIL
jgi:hypothetical protein